MALPAWPWLSLLSLCRTTLISAQLRASPFVWLSLRSTGPSGLEWTEQGFALLDGHWLGRLPCGAQSQEQPAGVG